jgi:hypothetical protein
MITHTVYHIYGYKVGCTRDFNRRCTEYLQRKGFTLAEIEILEELHDKTDQEAGDMEWQWADKFGYRREAHYTIMTPEQRAEGSKKGGLQAGKLGRTGFQTMTLENRHMASQKGGSARIQKLTNEERFALSQKGGLRAAELGRTGFQTLTLEQRKINGRKGGQNGHLKGGFYILSKCRHCGFESHKAILERWHQDNCPKKPVEL